MLLKYEGKENCQRLLSKYTVKNEDAQRKERILKRKCPRLQTVHLYTRVNDTYYFPVIEEISKQPLLVYDKAYNRQWNEDIILRPEQEYVTDILKKQRC